MLRLCETPVHRNASFPTSRPLAAVSVASSLPGTLSASSSGIDGLSIEDSGCATLFSALPPPPSKGGSKPSPRPTRRNVGFAARQFCGLMLCGRRPPTRVRMFVLCAPSGPARRCSHLAQAFRRPVRRNRGRDGWQCCTNFTAERGGRLRSRSRLITASSRAHWSTHLRTGRFTFAWCGNTFGGEQRK